MSEMMTAMGGAPQMTPEQARFRPAEDPAMSCATCQHFKGPGQCDFGFPSTPETTCDLHSGAQAAPDEAALMAQLFGGGGGPA